MKDEEIVEVKTQTALCCGKCGAAAVRLYRPYGMFYRVADNRCNECLSEQSEQRDWYVPCIADEDGTIWGYSSVPMAAIDRWDKLPDKNPNLPYWATDKSKWSNE